MSRRDSSASRSPSSARTSTRSSRSSRGPQPRADGKVDVSCPQCAARFRIAEDLLDQKLECSECHRVFFPKTTAGKRSRGQDHTKTYVIFGIVGVLIVGSFIAFSGDPPPAKPRTPPPPERPVVSVSTHPRAVQVLAWARAIKDGNEHVVKTHSDPAGLRAMLELPATADDAQVFAALKTHDAAKYLRTMSQDSTRLTSEDAMTSATGTVLLQYTPMRGDDDWRKDTRGETQVSFRMDGEQVKVTGWKVSMEPAWNTAKARPGKETFTPLKDIAKPDFVEITDSAGTRKVKESPPTALPHWAEATPEQQAKADEIVAQILKSADDEAPGGTYMRAVLQGKKSIEMRKATVPRVLNAMYELYGDVNGNALRLSQLDRAMRDFTGFAVNFDIAGTGDAAKDKQLRESCIRQWFAFWWRYANGELNEFIDMREDLETPLEDPKKPPPKK